MPSVLTCLLLLLILTGCGLPVSLMVAKTPEALFDQTLEESSAEDRAEALETLQQLYPQSEWTHRAESLARTVAERETATHDTTRRLRAAEKELAVSRRESENLRLELTQAKKDLEELKRLVIERELRAHPPTGKNR